MTAEIITRLHPRGKGGPQGFCAVPFKFVLDHTSIWRIWSVLMLKKWICLCFYTEQMDPMEHNSGFSCIHSSGILFHMFFKNTFWPIVPLFLKLSFFLTFFRILRFCLNIWVQKSCLMCLSNSIKLQKKSGRTSYIVHRTPYGRTSDIEI